MRHKNTINLNLYMVTSSQINTKNTIHSYSSSYIRNHITTILETETKQIKQQCLPPLKGKLIPKMLQHYAILLQQKTNHLLQIQADWNAQNKDKKKETMLDQPSLQDKILIDRNKTKLLAIQNSLHSSICHLQIYLQQENSSHINHPINETISQERNFQLNEHITECSSQTKKRKTENAPSLYTEKEREESQEMCISDSCEQLNETTSSHEKYLQLNEHIQTIITECSSLYTETEETEKLPIEICISDYYKQQINDIQYDEQECVYIKNYIDYLSTRITALQSKKKYRQSRIVSLFPRIGGYAFSKKEQQCFAPYEKWINILHQWQKNLRDYHTYTQHLINQRWLLLPSAQQTRKIDVQPQSSQNVLHISKDDAATCGMSQEECDYTERIGQEQQQRIKQETSFLLLRLLQKKQLLYIQHDFFSFPFKIHQKQDNTPADQLEKDIQIQKKYLSLRKAQYEYIYLSSLVELHFQKKSSQHFEMDKIACIWLYHLLVPQDLKATDLNQKDDIDNQIEKNPEYVIKIIEVFYQLIIAEPSAQPLIKKICDNLSHIVQIHLIKKN